MIASGEAVEPRPDVLGNVEYDACMACGFDVRSGTEVLDRLTVDIDRLAAATVRCRAPARRPADNVWSVLEYACHVRDVLVVQRERLLARVLVGAIEPTPMERDERAERDRYWTTNPSAVADQLRCVAAMFVHTAGALRRDDWALDVVYAFPTRTARNLAWLAVHTAHEVHHHLADVRQVAG